MEERWESDAFAPAMTSEEAALYASVRAGELVTGINSTTQQKIADVIETGIEDRLGVDGTARLLRATLADMTRLRSQMIASTEMNDAFRDAGRNTEKAETLRRLRYLERKPHLARHKPEAIVCPSD